MHRIEFGAALIACGVLSVVASGRQLVARQVVAPPSDIVEGVVRLPDPSSTPTESRAALFPLRFEARDGAWFAEVEFPVERDGGLTLALLSPAAASWRVLAAPRGSPLRAVDESYVLERRIGFADDLLPGWVIDRRDLRGAPAGVWSVRIEVEHRDELADGWLVASTASDVHAAAFVTTQRLVRGEPIAVAARASGRDFASVKRAKLVLDTLDGARELAMFDDGEHEDGAAGDGLFGALVPEDVAGPVQARAELAGMTHDGGAFLRTAPLAFTVLEPVLALDGSAQGIALDARHVRFEIGALPLGFEQRLHVSAEVWAPRNGAFVPVCWLSRMEAPKPVGAKWSLALDLDPRWLDLAGAAAPLELRQVRVQDPDTENVLAFAESIEVDSPMLVLREVEPAPSSAFALLASGGMPIGPFAPKAPSRFQPALMLVHGYCSSGSIWPAADFTQPKLEFLDPNANRTHDQFAQLIAARAQSQQLSSFGVVAHSQGGPASLHLLTYYTSGLDFASGGRRIQALASPFLGTPLASLGFFACGVNNDMTPSGASTWLAGIPSWARAEVYTFTTSNSGSACNFLTNLVLADPEDGTVEKTRSELPGGNNLGHTVGWCHTTGMSNPASYTDHSRNQSMNALAAR